MDSFKPTSEIPLSNSKIITPNNSTITISYNIETNNDIMKEYTKRIDPLKLIEFATNKVLKLLYGDADLNLNMTIPVKYNLIPDEKDGAYFSIADGAVNINLIYIQQWYENTTSDEFNIYIIGLMIHEITHAFSRLDKLAYDKDIFADAQTRIATESVCEYIRFISGFANPNWELKYSKKTLPTERYGPEPAYFHYWLNQQFPGFASKLLNSFFMDTKFETFLKATTSKSLEQLWREFNDVLPN
jgi:hypothetical protein